MHTMLDLYRRNARQHPDREAFVLGNKRQTYGEFYERARKLASAIQKTGIERQDTVGVFASNSIEFYEICAGCEISARIAALFNFRSAPPELEFLIGFSECKLLFFSAELAGVVDAVRDKAENVQTFICVGGDCPDWATPYEAFLASGNPDDEIDEPTSKDIGTLFFTSGTTGRPKGVPWTHQGMLTAALRSTFGDDESLLQISPAFHTGGRCPPVSSMWVAGKTVLDKNFDPVRWLQTVEKERITRTFLVPMMMQALLDHPDFEKYDLSSLEFVMAASTAIPPELLKRAIGKFGQVFYVAYGSTEAAGITRAKRSETRTDSPELVERLASVGHAETAVDMKLLDDDGNPVPHGEIGEVCVLSPVFIGYWKDPEATREAMHGDYVRTGDMGRFDDRDYLYLVDRKKDMIISGGENIYSREVEDALGRHEAVKSVAVIGVPDETWGEKVMAVVVLVEGITVSEEDLIAFSKTQLAAYKCPKTIAFVDELPLSGTNKIDKLKLRKTYSGQRETA